MSHAAIGDGMIPFAPSALECIVNEKEKNPSRRYAMRPTVNLTEEDRATDIGNIHTNLVKIARVVPGIACRTDRQTHRQTHSSQYFATAAAGEVKFNCYLLKRIFKQELTVTAIPIRQRESCDFMLTYVPQLPLGKCNLQRGMIFKN